MMKMYPNADSCEADYRGVRAGSACMVGAVQPGHDCL
jgi:hypothetical protein